LYKPAIFAIKAPLLAQLEHGIMSKVCQVTGKKPQYGNTVSHANNKSRRRFLPNLKKRRIWVQSENRFVTLNLSTQGLRIIDRDGIDAVLKKIRQKEKSK
jgi:large subunit ribosomal protein L28